MINKQKNMQKAKLTKQKLIVQSLHMNLIQQLQAHQVLQVALPVNTTNTVL